LGKVTEPCGAWWRIKEARRRSYDMSGRNLKVRLCKAALWVLSEYPPSLYKRGYGQSIGQSCLNPFPKSRSKIMPQKGTFHTTMMDKVRVALY